MRSSPSINCTKRENEFIIFMFAQEASQIQETKEKLCTLVAFCSLQTLTLMSSIRSMDLPRAEYVCGSRFSIAIAISAR
jgi:hypothetical protein